MTEIYTNIPNIPNLVPPDIVPVLIGFRMRPSVSDKDTIIRNRGQIKYEYTLINVIAASIPQQAIEAIKRNPNVEYVETDELVHTTYYQNYQQINTLQQTIPWGIDRIEAISAQSYTKGSTISVGVIDTGIDYTHPDLSLNYKGGYNFVNKTTNPMDDNGHGTHVSGTIAALNNDIGVIGVAPETNLYSIKVLDANGSGYMSDVIAGIQWSVDNGMKIVNMSLGSSVSSRSLKNACDTAYNSGLLIIASAGNSGNSAGKGNNVNYPARYDSVIAVAATDINNTRAWFSSTGPAVELSAPGVNIYSTLKGGTYGYLSGTSMAAPHVTGVAALIMSYNPITNVQTRIRLQTTTTDLGTIGKDNLYGYGLVNALKAVLGI